MDPMLTSMALGVTKWLIDSMLKTVASSVFEAWAIRQELGNDVKALQQELRHVHAVLCEAERRATDNQSFGEMVQELREAAYDADNILDELDYFRIRDEVKGTQEAADIIKESIFRRALHAVGDGLKLSLTHCCICATPCHHEHDEAPHPTDLDTSTPQSIEFDRVEMSRKLREATELLHKHRSRVHDILLILPQPTSTTTRIPLRIPTTSFQPPSDPKVVGRDELRDQVIGMLTGSGDNAPVLAVLPIVGQGGIGKTTFAHYVYNDHRLDSHLKIWVCVSLGAFDIITLTQKILEQILSASNEDGLKSNSTELNHLQSILLKRLNSSNKRLLLVLDDLWKCSPEEWDTLITPLANARSRGNVILVTTRIVATAKMVKQGDFNPLELKGLQPKFLWQYFKFCIFSDDSSDFSDSNMKDIAEKIVVQLKGSPLAAKTIGRLLGRHLDIKHWKEVLGKPLFRDTEKEFDIKSVLRISYEYLDFPVNRCFLYCGLFPDDYEFEAGELLRFWIGLGFIDCSNQTEPAEESCHEYLNILVDHGFFEKRVDGRQTSFLLHDFLHELARDLSSSECLVLDGSIRKNVAQTIRHLSILTKSAYQTSMECHESFKKSFSDLKRKLSIEKLSTLIFIGYCDWHLLNAFKYILQEARDLRVLHISISSDGTRISNPLSGHFLKLPHLRYLKDVIKFGEFKLLDSLSAPHQIKIIETNTKYAPLPNYMCDLVKLCYFIASEDLHSRIANVGRFKHLRELKMFNVGLDDAFSLRQLANMNELSGSLSIRRLENIQTIDEAREAKLEEKQIRSLALSWDDENSQNEQLIQHEVIEYLRPNKNIKEIKLAWYHGESIPNWLLEGDYYDSLEVLSFRSCLEWKVLSPFEMMYSLKKLEIIGLKRIRSIVFGKIDFKTTSSSRPLEVLVVGDMEALVKIEFKPLFPKLRDVHIAKCPMLVELDIPNSLVEDEKFQWFLQLERLTIKDCPQLQVILPALPHTYKLHSWYVADMKSLPYGSSSCDMKSLSLEGREDTKVIDNSAFEFSYLPELERLDVSRCPNLEQLCGLDKLKSLKYLCFSSCWSNAVPKHQCWLFPPSVTSLELWYCGITSQDLSLFLQRLPTLSDFKLVGCEQIYRIVIGGSVSEDAHPNVTPQRQ